MNTGQIFNSKFIKLYVMILTTILLLTSICFAQVSPVEIKNSQLKTTEQTYLTKLVAINQTVTSMKFPFSFSLNRYVNLDPQDQPRIDGRGLEFVHFHEKLVLKVSGNYNAAYNADMLTPNQRATHVFDEIILPILKLFPNYFSAEDGFSAFGFEIGYHVRRKANGYEYEGKELLTLVLDKADIIANIANDKDKNLQEILNRSEVFLDGKPFGLALNRPEPFNIEELQRVTIGKSNRSTIEARNSVGNSPILSQKATLENSVRAETPPTKAVPPATQLDVDRLQDKYKTQLDQFNEAGKTKYHFIDYSPPAFLLFRDRVFLQLTLRNPAHFDKENSSIYKRAAQSFDLFLALYLKSIVEKAPGLEDSQGLDITIINDLSTATTSSSEAIEFILPINTLKQFVGMDITNQDLINQSVILVNGVRISLNLQQVE